MILETPRLTLRPLVQSDASDIQKHFPHWDIVQYLAAARIEWPYPADGATRFLAHVALPAMERGQDWYWGITLKDKPEEVIGVVHLRRASEGGNRSMWISGAYQGMGLMSEALEAVNDYAFSALEFEKLVVKNAHANAASTQLKIKTGARLLDIRPVQPGHYVGDCTEQEVWEITRESWQAYKKAKYLAGTVARAFNGKKNRVNKPAPQKKPPRAKPR